MQGIKQCSQGGGSNLMYPKGEDTNRKTPLRFWEIDQFFKCPVVGMCLTLSEQKQLLKKTGFSVKKKSPFEIHETLVASSESDNRLSRRVDNLLNRKFSKESTFFPVLCHEKFKAHWKVAFRDGNCTGVLWGAAINPQLPIELKREIFGEIHMTMHWSGGQSIKLKQKLARQQKALGELRRNTKDTSRIKRLLQKENKRLRQHLADLRTTLAVVERDKNKLEGDLAELNSQCHFDEIEQENRILKEKLNAVLVSAKDKQRLMTSLEEKNKRLLSEIERQQDSNSRFKKEAQKIIGEVFALNRCDATCPQFDLCKKRILIVGGITRMESLYRELIGSSCI